MVHMFGEITYTWVDVPEETRGSREAGVAGGCEPLDIGAGTQTDSLQETCRRDHFSGLVN